jgi:hypothetical protein
LVVGLTVVWGVSASAQSNTPHGSIMAGASGSVCFPTGRFSETDPDSNKPGHNTGYGLRGELGYAVSEALHVGLGVDRVSFSQNFDELPEFDVEDGHTNAVTINAWSRFFLPGGYTRWRPYVFVSLGMGIASGDVQFPVSPLDPEAVQEIATDVDPAFAISGGVGAIVPVGKRLSFMIEPRYRSVSTKGTSRTEKWTFANGETIEFDEITDEFGNTVKLTAKSNTNWWEIRGGLIFLIR